MILQWFNLPFCLSTFSHFTFQFFVQNCAILWLVNFMPFLIQFPLSGMPRLLFSPSYPSELKLVIASFRNSSLCPWDGQSVLSQDSPAESLLTFYGHPCFGSVSSICLWAAMVFSLDFSSRSLSPSGLSAPLLDSITFTGLWLQSLSSELSPKPPTYYQTTCLPESLKDTPNSK